MSDQPEINLGNFSELFSQVMDTIDNSLQVSAEADLTLPDNPVTVGGRVKSADDWASKQIERSMAAGPDWKKGVLSPRRHPIEAALAADGKRKQKLAEAEREGRWAASMRRVDVDEMYATIEDGGEDAYTAGIRRRQGKIKKKVGRLQPLVEGLAKTLDAMPQDTDAQREAKMIAAKRGMQGIGRKLRGISS
jgi:hypothetical protein